MSENSAAIEKRIVEWVNHWVVNSQVGENALIAPLAGDGSLRRFFRVRIISASPSPPSHKSFVLLSDPGWTFSKDYAPHQAYLSSVGLPVPRFLFIDEKQGLAVMEDKGDELLQFRLRKLQGQSGNSLSWLEKAVRLLAQLHGKTFPVPKELPASSRRFDAQKYFEELSFTFEHLHEGLLRLEKPQAEDKKALWDFCQKIAAVLPDVFCHRDYHTRNILVWEEKLFLIDYQDARLGAPQYDLASLLYDAYLPITDTERTCLTRAYREEVQKYPLYSAISWATFEQDLKRVALQRVIKAAGSFASFYTRFGKRTHLPYLLPALHSAQALAASDKQNEAAVERALPLSHWIERTPSALASL